MRSVYQLAVSLTLAGGVLWSSSMGGVVQGTVKDPSGAVVPGATVSIRNPITGFERSAASDAAGRYRILGVPFNQYHLSAAKDGFAAFERDVAVRSVVPVEIDVPFALAGTAATVNVEAATADILENVPFAHYDADRATFSRLPMVTPANTLSDTVTMLTPGVVASSNGFFHPLGDHAQTSFVVDGQPVNDQQSKQFSTQLPSNALQAMELITGGVAAEFGDKTSLVVNTQTRSGLDAGAHGNLNVYYGSFGTIGEDATLSTGSKTFGNFLAANSVRTGRFLDTPEFSPIHGIGNGIQIFDRMDFRPNDRHAFNLNLFGARNWFQVPNSLDQLNQDQRQRSTTFSANGGYRNTSEATSVWGANAWVRQDRLGYFPSADYEDDYPASVQQSRHLTNWGLRTDGSIVSGVHNAKAGILWSQTKLRENFFLIGEDIEAIQFNGRGNVNQVAWYGQDSMRFGNLLINAGLRFDHYSGPSHGNRLQPRAGASYLISKTGTILRGAYTHSFETPYNENLLLASFGGRTLGEGFATPIQPGRRNQFNAGFQQAITRWVQVDADYFWKYTDNAYDFEALFNTPIFIPISLQKSKIDGFAIRASTANIKGFQAYTLLGRSRSRFFGPINGGLELEEEHHEGEEEEDEGGHGHGGVFRIDHDQAFQQTTFLRYQVGKTGPWFSFTWRYDSGMVTGIGDEHEILELTGAQQAAMGLFCGNTFATPDAPITECGQPLQATRVRIPEPGTENPDHNPARIAPRHLFNLGVGTDSLWKSERFNMTARFTVVNLTNRMALYNFLSVFAGTHFVTPRAYTAEIGFRF
jgi:outer membrane cobalamin receptor